NLGTLQENLLSLLSYDDEKAKIIRGAVDVDLYGGPYRLIAVRLYDYIDRYKKAPKDHIADLMEDKLNDKKGREGDLYIDIISSIRDAYQGINAEYVMSQLATFSRRQRLRSVTVELGRALQKDTDASLDDADRIIKSLNHADMKLFEIGTRLSDKDKVLSFLDIQNNCFPTGIPELDKRGFGPTRKELWLYIADTKKGKTWALIQLAKMAMMQRLKVVHMTLEMSEERSAQRYLQSLFGMSKRREKFINTMFLKDSLGRIDGFDEVEVTPTLAMEDKNIRKQLEKRIDKWKNRILKNVIIKQFPTGHLTMSQFRSYLDGLEASENFIPDLVILDYPDLMKIDKANPRMSLDEIYKELRGTAIERNHALAVVSQSHRAAAKAKKVDRNNVAEAYSKIAHADCIITYSQTEAERALGLARLYVSGGRNDQDQITVVISQQYAMGTFVFDSTLMAGKYWDHVPKPEDEE
ncbi:MAG TPA: DnaB-like helicase C-terminal domain-containing protein, partial [Anaerovoracaceae bacterium]|nr:DnaB-like helicase C-terminal domain-containing protein [Anaerovoracaceae bacterium]